VPSLFERGLVKENRDHIKRCTKSKLIHYADGTTGGAKIIVVVLIPKDFVLSVLQTVDFAKSVAYLRETVTLDVAVLFSQVSS